MLDARLPVNVERGCNFGDMIETDISAAIDGTEQRSRRWLVARGSGDIGYALRAVKDVADQVNYIRQVDAFHKVCAQEIPFRFRDWFDYTAADERFGTGDGSTLAFQLIKTYDPVKLITGSAGLLTYVRTIYLLQGMPTIKAAGVTTVPASIVNGLVTFSSAPASLAALTWSTAADGGYDKLVRFDTNKLPVTMRTGRHAEIGRIPIIEVLGAAELTA